MWLYNSLTTRSCKRVAKLQRRLGGPLGLPRHTWQHPGTPEGVARAALWCASACENRRRDSPRITNDVFSGMLCWGNVPSVYFWKFLALRRRVQSVRKYHACQSKSRFSLLSIGVVRRGACTLFFIRKPLQKLPDMGPRSSRGPYWGPEPGRK